MIIKLVFKYDVNVLSFYSNVWETLVFYIRNGNITLIPIIRDVRVEMSRKIFFNFMDPGLVWALKKRVRLPHLPLLNIVFFFNNS